MLCGTRNIPYNFLKLKTSKNYFLITINLKNLEEYENQEQQKQEQLFGCFYNGDEKCGFGNGLGPPSWRWIFLVFRRKKEKVRTI